MTETSQHTDANAELLRLQYLQLLGITSYYPRLILPGAAPSQACDWPAIADAPEAAPAEAAVPADRPAVRDEPAARAAAPPRVAPGLSARLESGTTVGPDKLAGPDSAADGAGESAVPASRPTPATPAVPEAHESPIAELRFQLLLLTAGDGLAVCNRIPVQARPQLGERESRLLHNILLWLGTSLSGEVAPRHFLWPLPNMGAGTAEQAGLGLFGFLQQARKEFGFRHLLLMGCSDESLEPVLPALRRGLEAAAGWRQYETHSLSELLALPELKREAWKRMQPLHAELSGQGR